MQIYIGGVMAGMKAGLAAPTWPKIQDQWIPEQIYHLSDYNNYLFTEYEISHSGPVIVQFIHRALAYLILLLILSFCIHVSWKYKIKKQWKAWGLFLICLLQIFLGVWTLIHCVGFVPLWSAVFHQIIGILLLIYILWLYFTYQPFSENKDP